MARASKADLDAALDVSNIIEQLEQGYMPSTNESDDLERFDSDDREQCQRAIGAILAAAAKGSMFRVTFGMTVVLDPRNELLDPAADTLELHPKLVAARDCAADAERSVITYINQPDNVRAWRLGEACRAAKLGGDPIDHGLSLLKELQAKGFGVVAIDVAHIGDA
ncbi:hypothetical protein DF035_00605 [Burkholderia contaminans]|nr:hypothetical protein DF035_00605 [Burkholderia contaminans]